MRRRVRVPWLFAVSARQISAQSQSLNNASPRAVLRDRGVRPLFQAPGLPVLPVTRQDPRTRARAAFPAPRARAKVPPGHLYTAAAARRRAPRTGKHAEDQTDSTRWAPTSPSTPSPEARSPRGGRASSPKFCTEATTRRQIGCSSSEVGTGKKRVLSSSPWRLFVAPTSLPFVGFRLLSRYLQDRSFSIKTGAEMPEHYPQAASPAGPAGVGFLISFLCSS